MGRGLGGAGGMASTPREGGGRPMTPGEGGAPSPALQLIVRQKGSAELRDVTSEETFAAAALPSFACDPDAVLAEYSPCSKLIACVHSETGVNIVSSETGALVCTFAKAKISQVSWSPQSSYLLTWGRWEKDAMNLLYARPPLGSRICVWTLLVPLADRSYRQLQRVVGRCARRASGCLLAETTACPRELAVSPMDGRRADRGAHRD